MGAVHKGMSEEPGARRPAFSICEEDFALNLTGSTLKMYNSLETLS